MQNKTLPEIRPRILLVDDDPEITFTFKLGLEDHGFYVDTYNNPILVLSNYKSGFYDLLLLDIRMHIMDGFELYREIRKIDANVKVCFITAYEINNDDFKKSFPEMALKYFIKKPVTIENLAKILDQKLSEDLAITG